MSYKKKYQYHYQSARGHQQSRGVSVARPAATQLEAGAPVEDGDAWSEGMLRAFGFVKEKPVERVEPRQMYVPKTDAHLQALEDIRKSMEGKNVPRDEFGIAKVNCWCRRPDFCQICDDRQGSWANDPVEKEDHAFKRYQANLLGQQPPRIFRRSKRTEVSYEEVPSTSRASLAQETEETRVRQLNNFRHVQSRSPVRREYKYNQRQGSGA